MGSIKPIFMDMKNELKIYFENISPSEEQKKRMLKNIKAKSKKEKSTRLKALTISAAALAASAAAVFAISSVHEKYMFLDEFVAANATPIPQKTAEDFNLAKIPDMIEGTESPEINGIVLPSESPVESPSESPIKKPSEKPLNTVRPKATAAPTSAARETKIVKNNQPQVPISTPQAVRKKTENTVVVQNTPEIIDTFTPIPEASKEEVKTAADKDLSYVQENAETIAPTNSALSDMNDDAYSGDVEVADGENNVMQKSGGGGGAASSESLAMGAPVREDESSNCLRAQSLKEQVMAVPYDMICDGEVSSDGGESVYRYTSDNGGRYINVTIKQSFMENINPKGLPITKIGGTDVVIEEQNGGYRAVFNNYNTGIEIIGENISYEELQALILSLV